MLTVTQYLYIFLIVGAAYGIERLFDYADAREEQRFTRMIHPTK